MHFLLAMLFLGNAALTEISSYLRSLPILPLLSELAEKGTIGDIICFENAQNVPVNVNRLEGMVAACRDRLLFEVNEPMVIAETVAKAILDAIKENPVPNGADNGIDNIISMCCKLTDQGVLSKGDVSRHLCYDCVNIPLGILMKLVNAGILLWTDYIDVKKEAGGGSSLDFLLLEVRNKTHDEDSRGVILQLILSLMHLEPKAGKIYERVFRNINKMIYEVFEIHDFSRIFTDTKKIFLLSMLGNIKARKKGMNSEFFLNLLTGYLKTGLRPTIEESYHEHGHWTFRNLSENAIESFQCFILNINTDALSSTLSSSIRDDNCNIKRLFFLVSVWLVTEEDSIPRLNAIIDRLLLDALEIQRCSLLKLSLLMARHCSLEHSSGFPSYQKWLKKTYADLEDLFVSNRDALAAYMRCIIGIVPLESKDFLSVQLSVLPQIPASAKHFVNDYVIVAKAMLKDLSKDEGASSSTSTDSVSLAARADVETGLRQFRENGVVPKSILEMSVFRKGYFVGSFLPILLNPEAVKNDKTRQLFIDHLRRSGKVPSKIYSNYCQEIEREKTAACFAKAGHNLNEVFDIVVRKIKELPDLIKYVMKIEEPKKQRSSLQLYIASLSAHLTKFYNALGQYKESKARQQLRGKEVIDIFLDNLCYAYALSVELEKSPFEAVELFIQPIIRSLHCHYMLICEVKGRLLELLHTEMSALEKYHLQALAGISSALEDSKKLSCENSSAIREAVFCSIGSTSRSFSKISNSLEFVSYVLLFCKKMYADVVVLKDDVMNEVNIVDEAVFIHSSILELWLMLHCKLSMTVAVIEDYDELALKVELKKLKNVLEVADTVKQEEIYSSALASLKFDVNEWVEFEMQMDDEEDLLPQYLKKDYYYRVIELNAEVQQASDNWTYPGVATAIVMNMLNTNPAGKFQSPIVCGRYDHVDASNVFTGEENYAIDGNERKSAAKFLFRSKERKPYPNSLLCLLRSLSKEIAPVADADEYDLFSVNRSWLFQSIDNWLTRITGDDDTAHHLRRPEVEISCFCSLLDALPSELLFATTAAEIDTDEIFSDIIALINKSVMAFCSDEPFIPCSVTMRFLAAFVDHFYEFRTLADRTKNGKNINTQFFISACPVFFISLVKHSRNPTLAKNIHTAAVNGVACFQSVIDLIDALKISDYQRAALIPLSSTVIAVSIYNEWFNSQPKAKEACLPSILSLNEDLLEMMLECMFWDLVSNIIQGHPLSGNSFTAYGPMVRLIMRIPSRAINLVCDILQGRNDNGIKDLRSLIVKKQSAQLFPMAFIKILAGMDVLYLRRLSRMDSAKRTIIECIEKCNSVMNAINTGPTRNVPLSPFDLAFLKEVATIEQILEIRK